MNIKMTDHGNCDTCPNNSWSDEKFEVTVCVCQRCAPALVAWATEHPELLDVIRLLRKQEKDRAQAEYEAKRAAKNGAAAR